VSLLPSTPVFFFFQAEDGIRDRNVTGVQTCALPILILSSLFTCMASSRRVLAMQVNRLDRIITSKKPRIPIRGSRAATPAMRRKIGRASCRERGERAAVSEGG